MALTVQVTGPVSSHQFTFEFDSGLKCSVSENSGGSLTVAVA